MSSTNKTTNYELSQFVGTDIPSILVDYNGDMRKIDTAIKEVAVAGGDSAVAIAELQGTTARHTTEINGITETVNNVSGRVLGLEESVSGVEAVIPSTASASNKLITEDDNFKVRATVSVDNNSTIAQLIVAIERKLFELGWDNLPLIKKCNAKIVGNHTNIKYDQNNRWSSFNTGSKYSIDSFQIVPRETPDTSEVSVKSWTLNTDSNTTRADVAGESASTYYDTTVHICW